MNYLVRDRGIFFLSIAYLFGVKKGRFTFFKWKLAFDDYVIKILVLGLPA